MAAMPDTASAVFMEWGHPPPPPTWAYSNFTRPCIGLRVQVIAFPTYAVIGAGASLGGATRMTVSITILITETTGAGQLVIPLMITIFLSKLVGDFFNESIYDVHIHLRGAPILEEVRCFYSTPLHIEISLVSKQP